VIPQVDITHTPPEIGGVLAEVATLAREFEDTPLWQRERVREGAITMQQQAERFAAARDDGTRADAALWAHEGYQLLSAGLSATYPTQDDDERASGWLTAHQIARLFGPAEAWGARVKLTCGSPWPDASRHDPAPEYLRGLVLLAGLSQRKAAAVIGISERVMRYYLAEGETDSRIAPYPVQYTLEQLARRRLQQK